MDEVTEKTQVDTSRDLIVNIPISLSRDQALIFYCRRLYQISLKFLSLNVMSILVSAKTRYEDTIKTRLRVTGGLTAVVRLLKAELSPIKHLLSSVQKGKVSKRSAQDKWFTHCLYNSSLRSDQVQNFFSRQLSLSNPDATLNLERIEQCLKILEKLTSFCPENQLHIVKNEEELFPLMLEFLLYCQVEACNRDSYEASLGKRFVFEYVNNA